MPMCGTLLTHAVRASSDVYLATVDALAKSIEKYPLISGVHHWDHCNELMDGCLVMSRDGGALVGGEPPHSVENHTGLDMSTKLVLKAGVRRRRVSRKKAFGDQKAFKKREKRVFYFSLQV